jgi:hypothetical protein
VPVHIPNVRLPSESQTRTALYAIGFGSYTEIVLPVIVDESELNAAIVSHKRRNFSSAGWPSQVKFAAFLLTISAFTRLDVRMA